MTLFFQDKAYKLWKDFMTIAYYASPDAAKGVRRLHEKGEKVWKNWLKKLEGIMLPEIYKKVATEMLEKGTTLQSLQQLIDTIIIEQWVMMHLDHPNNIQYVRPEKGVYSSKGLECFSTRLYICFSYCVLSQRHAHPCRGCSTRKASLEVDSWYTGLSGGT